MKYMGGKSRFGKKIAEIIKKHHKPGQDYLEPFCGSCAVLEHVNIPGVKRTANDLHPYLIAMMKAVQDGWLPPTVVTEAEYKALKASPENYEPHLVGFMGFAVAFAAKWMSTYARGGTRNYADESSRSLLKQKPFLQDVNFTCVDYRSFDPTNTLVYCDPPYANTSRYGGVPSFDSELFWETMKEWASPERNNTVIISEYTIPDWSNIKELAVWETKTSLTQKLNTANSRVERLFLVEPEITVIAELPEPKAVIEVFEPLKDFEIDLRAG